ncbi:hypothetical protein CUMW_174760 [Citrus unshiu]|uniref:Pentacotripeptide-repeat region of PRORP domain-containing protein n=3 Tax=Citrus TaxID=2706 RepID=A0A2H5PXL5_CITUN|nr:hypothetical protein CUMW_174760 [Citrus unshiu]
MISSLASNSREKEALVMVDEMYEKGLRANEVTFVAVLTACARARLVELGLELFHSLLGEFEVVPIMEHYGCVVDLLGRAGLLSEANEFLWSACKIHGAVKLSHEVGKRLLELQPEHCRRYVVLSNVHTGVERRDGQLKM